MPERLFIKIAVLPFLMWAFVFTSVVLGAAPNDAVLKAKREAESNGYIFVASRDEIVARAKKEGRLRAVSGLSGPAILQVSSYWQPGGVVTIDLRFDPVDWRDRGRDTGPCCKPYGAPPARRRVV